MHSAATLISSAALARQLRAEGGLLWTLPSDQADDYVTFGHSWGSAYHECSGIMDGVCPATCSYKIQIQRLFATICREQVVPTGVIGGIAIVIEWILLILLMLAWSEVENEICPLMVPEVWTPELGKVL